MNSAVDAFISIQTTYKVNGVFAMAVTKIESTCGTAWAAIDSSTYNWFSISGSYKGQSYHSNRDWRKYSSFSEATRDFGDLIANESFYFKAGKYTVKEIAPTYCNEEWGDSVVSYMKEIYTAAGVSFSTSSGSGGSIVSVAEEMHTYMEKNKYTYDAGVSTFEKSKSLNQHYTVCAGFVSWVMQEAGYINESGFSNMCSPLYSTLTSKGFKDIGSDMTKAQPGDIFFYGRGPGDFDHTDIYIGNNNKLSWGITTDPYNYHYEHYFSELCNILRAPDTGRTNNSSKTFKSLLNKANITENTLNSKGAKQLIIVNSSGTSASVTYYEKTNNGWKAESSLACNGFVGSQGVTSSPSESKSATPKGLYSIGDAFYQGSEAPNTGLKTFKITNNTYWIDDPKSSYYNRKYVGNKLSSIANSAERMWQVCVYKYGFVINYNMDPIVKGKGSAIFFHISNGKPTGGCVSVSESMILKYLARLDKDKKPYILIV